MIPNVFYVLRWGTRGEQLGYVTRSPRGAWRVEKWRKNSRRWTRPVALAQALVLRQATAADLRRFGYYPAAILAQAGAR